MACLEIVPVFNKYCKATFKTWDPEGRNQHPEEGVTRSGVIKKRCQAVG